MGEDNSAEKFRRQLASEVARLNQLCDAWGDMQQVLREPMLSEVMSAVGLARLLITSKMQQFATLVERCARPEPGVPLILPTDLLGFWEMLQLQIENVDMRFKRLSAWRARNWVGKISTTPVKKVAAKKKVAQPAAGPSRPRETIAARRKAQ